jgi:hypothetical protein
MHDDRARIRIPCTQLEGSAGRAYRADPTWSYEKLARGAVSRRVQETRQDLCGAKAQASMHGAVAWLVVVAGDGDARADKDEPCRPAGGRTASAIDPSPFERRVNTTTHHRRGTPN